jgi:BirA family biotin operon repressor/biotin-[acetyl-CoA-carboxylase] ligase
MDNLEIKLEELELTTLDLKVKVFDELDSTNTDAKRCIIDGIKQDLLIVTSMQTAGRGRQTRTWFSPRGGLYFSLVVRPRLGPHFAPLASFLLGCAVAKGLQSFGLDNVRVKWPNDVLIGEDKIAGILNELVSIDPVDAWMILGVGVNQNIRANEFPQELLGVTTSVFDVLGKETSLESLLISIVSEIDCLFGIVESEKSYFSVMNLWRSMSNTLGRRVRVNDGFKEIVGIAEDVLDDGTLIVNTGNTKEMITMGDVTHLRSD